MRVNGRVVWLWCWLGVLVAGCSQNPGTGPQTATLSLLNLNNSPFTPTPTLWLRRTPTLRATLMMMTLAPTPLPLPVTAPDCYETPIGAMWCLGVVRNKLVVPVEHVTIRIYLVTREGIALAQREVTTAHVVIKPGEMSPYGVLFDTIPAGAVGPIALLVSAAKAQTPLPFPLTVQDLRGDKDDSSAFHFSGKLANTGAIALRRIELTITLLDNNERITGYRQLRWPPDKILLPGETLPFTMSVIPQGLGSVRFEANATGYPTS